MTRKVMVSFPEEFLSQVDMRSRKRNIAAAAG